jgi:hypothetical protein
MEWEEEEEEEEVLDSRTKKILNAVRWFASPIQEAPGGASAFTLVSEPLGADDGIRTRDPTLGKVARGGLATCHDRR